MGSMVKPSREGFAGLMAFAYKDSPAGPRIAAATQSILVPRIFGRALLSSTLV